jgi:hypothetical protein
MTFFFQFLNIGKHISGSVMDGDTSQTKYASSDIGKDQLALQLLKCPVYWSWTTRPVGPVIAILTVKKKKSLFCRGRRRSNESLSNPRAPAACNMEKLKSGLLEKLRRNRPAGIQQGGNLLFAEMKRAAAETST